MIDLQVEYNDEKTQAKIYCGDNQYIVHVGTYEGVLPRIWVDDYSTTGVADVFLDDLINPLNKETERGAVVEKAIEIHKELVPYDTKYEYM